MEEYIQEFNYEKMIALTNDLLNILMTEQFNEEHLIIFGEKIKSSQEYFKGKAAEAFRNAAQEALKSYSIDNNDSIVKLINVAQMPRNNAETMMLVDKIISSKISNILKTK